MDEYNYTMKDFEDWKKHLRMDGIQIEDEGITTTLYIPKSIQAYRNGKEDLMNHLVKLIDICDEDGLIKTIELLDLLKIFIKEEQQEHHKAEEEHKKAEEKQKDL